MQECSNMSKWKHFERVKEISSGRESEGEDEEINRDWMQLSLGSLQPTVNNFKKLGHRRFHKY